VAVSGGRWQWQVSDAGGRSLGSGYHIRWDADHSHSESHVAILKRMNMRIRIRPSPSFTTGARIINVCKTPHQHCVDTRTIAIAQAIVAEARTALPHDKVLAAAVWRIPLPCGAPFSPPWK